tara:strand:+ start:1245 stop:2372 length:1128 start_codon:yes stop_codon:yes gene_type:complete
MKLLMHIGTHKTATSSLQLFLLRNRKILEKAGVYYPLPPEGKKNFNNVAEHLAKGDLKKIVKIFKKICKAANQKKIDKIIISAESFYAMTKFYGNNLKTKSASYFENEEKNISNLFEACKVFDKVEVVCYFRSQDEFASSIYNQEVKSDFGISNNFIEFLNLNPELFDYISHIKIFEKYFSHENIKCVNFEEKKNIFIKDFCENFVSNNFYDLCNNDDYKINQRLNRDCLEYKKVFNRLSQDKALHFFVANALKDLSLMKPDEKKNHIYAPLKNRLSFFSKYEKGNNDLCAKYSIDHMPIIINKMCHVDGTIKVKKFVPPITKFLKSRLKKPNKFTNFFIRKQIYYLIKVFPNFNYFFKKLRILKKYFKHFMKID